jgi:STE24 endopeptidase
MVGTLQQDISPWRAFPASPDEWYEPEEMAKADEYGKPLRRVLFGQAVVAFAVDVAVVGLHVAPRAIRGSGATNWVAGLLVAILVITVVSTVVSLPVSAWRELGYDRRFGFSKQTTKGFVTDVAKAVPIGLVVNALLFVPLFAIIRSVDAWWLVGGAVFAFFNVAIGVLYPVVVAPLFNKYTPLEDGELRTRILDAAGHAGADITEVLVEDSSKRDTRPNAYVAGLGKVRRVVLFDNILRYPDDAVVSVVAHEIGHWKLRHILRTIPAILVIVFATFALLSALMENDALLRFAGVHDPGDPGALPLFLLLFLVVFRVMGLALAWLSRAHERQADLFAYRLLGSPAELRDFVHDISVENLMDLRPTPWRRLKASHPPFAERMAMADAWTKGRPAG